MGLAYGLPLKGYASLAEWEAAAVERWHEVRAEPRDVLFRVETVSYAAIQPFADPATGDGEWYTTDPRIELFVLTVLKWTPTGARLAYADRFNRDRWTSLDPQRKQWASRTAAEALVQFRDRRRAQVHILKGQLRRAERELALADAALNPEQ